MNGECSPTVELLDIFEVKSEYFIKVEIKACYELVIEGSSAALITAILYLRFLVSKLGIKHLPRDPHYIGPRIT